MTGFESQPHRLRILPITILALDVEHSFLSLVKVSSPKMEEPGDFLESSCVGRSRELNYQSPHVQCRRPSTIIFSIYFGYYYGTSASLVSLSKVSKTKNTTLLPTASIMPQGLVPYIYDLIDFYWAYSPSKYSSAGKDVKDYADDFVT